MQNLSRLCKETRDVDNALSASGIATCGRAFIHTPVEGADERDTAREATEAQGVVERQGGSVACIHGAGDGPGGFDALAGAEPKGEKAPAQAQPP